MLLRGPVGLTYLMTMVLSSPGAKPAREPSPPASRRSRRRGPFPLKVADALALEDDVVVPGSTATSGFWAASSGKGAGLEGELTRLGIGWGEDELLGVEEEAGTAVVDLDHEPLTGVPLDLERPLGPSRDQVVLARDGQLLAVGLRLPEGRRPALGIDLEHAGLDVDRMPDLEQMRVEMDLGDRDLIGPRLVELVRRFEQIGDLGRQRALRVVRGAGGDREPVCPSRGSTRPGRSDNPSSANRSILHSPA